MKYAPVLMNCGDDESSPADHVPAQSRYKYCLFCENVSIRDPLLIKPVEDLKSSTPFFLVDVYLFAQH